MFRYNTGEIVKEGDLVRYRSDKWRTARIKEIVPPGTWVGQDLVCQCGGVFVELDTDEGNTSVVLETDEVLGEDCVFVGRKQDTRRPDERRAKGLTSPQKQGVLYYKTGETVKEGDLLQVFVGEWRPGRVVGIVPSGANLENGSEGGFVCEEGGIKIEIDSDRNGPLMFPTILVIPTNNVLHQDYVFVRREKESNCS